jgi:hypothetical protein
MRKRTYKRLAAIDENMQDRWAVLAIQRLLKYARP